MENGLTILPGTGPGRETEQPSPGSRAVDIASQVLFTYLESAGIESGYGYFAPNVPDPCKVTFELHYKDGRIERQGLTIRSSAAQLRFDTLIENLASPEYEPVRPYVAKLLSYSIWREHPDLESIRAIFSFVTLPTPAELRRGRNGSEGVMFAFDFSPRDRLLP